MVRIFRDKSTGDFVVQTSCLTPDDFILELSEALHKAMTSEGNDGETVAMGVLTNAMPIAYKLSGYKAETVSEQRTLVCGNVSVAMCEVVATVGK